MIGRIQKLFCAVLVAGAALMYAQEAPPAPVTEPQQDMPHLGLSLEWSSKYVYQGQVWNDQPVMIGDVWLEFHGFYAGVFGIYDLTQSAERNGFVWAGGYDSDRKWRFEEIDYYLGYTYTFEELLPFSPLTLDLNWNYKQYPTASQWDSAEVTFTATLDELYATESSFLSSSLELGHDYELETTWVALGGAFKQILDDDGDFALRVTGDLYWGDTKKMRDYAWAELESPGFYAVVFGAELHCRLTDNLSLVPFVSMATYPDSRIRQDAKDSPMSSRSEYWGGIRATLQF